MKLLTKVVNVLPELYLILSVLYYWALTALWVNPIAIILVLVLVFQILTRKLIVGIVIAIVLILINSYLVLALLSELSEFPEFNIDSLKLAVFGFLYLGFNIIVGGIMLYRYINKSKLKQTKIINNS